MPSTNRTRIVSRPRWLTYFRLDPWQNLVEAMYKRVTLVVKPGQIIFADAKVECTIRTMSRFGASIEASSRANIPDQFVLLVSSDHKSYACNVVRRRGKRMVIAFA